MRRLYHYRCLWLSFCLALLFCLPLRPVQAQTESEPPADVLATLKPGGVSLRFVALPVGADGVHAWAHLSVVPVSGQSPEGKPKGTAFTRADIEQQVIALSPFTLDIFTRAHNKLERRCTVVLPQQIAPKTLQALWRAPAQKRGLVLVLPFEIGNFGTAYAVSLNDQLHPIGIQQFGYSHDPVEPEYYSELSFDQTDAQGILKIGVVLTQETNKQTHWYEWDGTGFVDKTAAFFVIATIKVTRPEAEAFVARRSLSEYEIVATGRYKRLPPHRYAVVVGRFHDRQQAEDFVAQRRPEDEKYTLMQAF